MIRTNARVAELVDARDLANMLSTQDGNAWCEWSQIRGTLSALGGGNPELSLVPEKSAGCEESVET